MLRSRNVLRFAGLCALASLAGCGDLPSPAPPTDRVRSTLSSTAAAAPRIVARGPGGGLRVDLTGDTQHVRARQRQPDGSYKSVCVDAPGSLRPATTPAQGDGAGERR